MRLLAIGLVAGFFSALFGVGGGLLVVPLLILLLGFPERAAMATSLAAIGVIATVGAIAYGVRGEVDPAAAAVVGLPAALGAVVGTGVQQRLTGRALGLGFAAFLVLLGLGAVAGVEAGVRVAQGLPEEDLRRLFALLMFAVAAQIAWRYRRPSSYPPPDAPPPR